MRRDCANLCCFINRSEVEHLAIIRFHRENFLLKFWHYLDETATQLQTGKSFSLLNILSTLKQKLHDFKEFRNAIMAFEKPYPSCSANFNTELHNFASSLEICDAFFLKELN